MFLTAICPLAVCACVCVPACTAAVQVWHVGHGHTHTHPHLPTHTDMQKVVLRHPYMMFNLLSQKPCNPSVALIPLISEPKWRHLEEKSALAPENVHLSLNSCRFKQQVAVLPGRRFIQTTGGFIFIYLLIYFKSSMFCKSGRCLSRQLQ